MAGAQAVGRKLFVRREPFVEENRSLSAVIGAAKPAGNKEASCSRDWAEVRAPGSDSSSFAEDPEVMLQESIEEMRNTLPRLNQILVTTRATVIRLEQEREAGA